MKVGDLVKVTLPSNSFLDGKIGTVVLSEKYQDPIYGICILIDEKVYGFKENEIKTINEKELK